MGGLQPQTLPRSGSAVGSDQTALGFTQSGLESPQAGEGPTSIPPALSPQLGCPRGEKPSAYLQPEPLVFQLVPLTLALS